MYQSLCHVVVRSAAQMPTVCIGMSFRPFQTCFRAHGKVKDNKDTSLRKQSGMSIARTDVGRKFLEVRKGTSMERSLAERKD